MSRPSVFSWATVSGRRAVPNSDKISSGVSPKERLGDRLFNWLIGTLGDWSSWLNANVIPDETDATGGAGYLTGLRWQIFPATPTYGAGLHYLQAHTATDAFINLSLPLGAVIQHVDVVYKRISGTITATLEKIDDVGSHDDTLATLFSTGSGTAWTKAGADVVSAPFQSDTVLTVRVSGNSFDLSHLMVSFTRPAIVI